ncbi:putative SUMO ligase SizA [Plectosphaerella plurivora]|uniref:SUMO ligase SizA n=1 Tax=Plectosphaerella plurivora TaxID=936078 RepID=A0A9P8V4C8_9PEZI|nr:putative SUMO ligase SizA [Plectosphaerella plurivora]
MQEVPRADASALVKLINSTTLLNKQLSAICQLNGLTSSGVKAHLQARIVNLIQETINQRDLARFRQIETSVSTTRANAQTHRSSPAKPYDPPMPPHPNRNNYFAAPQPSYGGAHVTAPMNGYSSAMQPGLMPQCPPVCLPSRLLTQAGITFKPSPFYDIRYSIGPVRTCESKQTLIILNSCLTDKSMRVMVFCATDRHGTNDIAFPHQCEIKVNGGEVKANLRGLKNKPGSTRPVDVTDLLRLKPSNYENRVELTYALTQKPFYFGLFLCKAMSVQQLAEKIQVGRKIPIASVIQEITRKAADTDIVTTSQVVSLKCPLSYMRLQVPCRGVVCTHIQCFDATSYLQLQEQGPQWLCPICNKSVTYENLAVDEYVRDILAKTPESAEQVTIMPNAEWRMGSAQNDKGGAGASSAATLDGDDDLEISEVSYISGGRQLQTPIRSVQSTATPTTTGVSRESSSLPRGSGSISNKRPAAVVVDLTLSSDDEEGMVNRKRRSSASAWTSIWLMNRANWTRGSELLVGYNWVLLEGGAVWRISTMSNHPQAVFPVWSSDDRPAGASFERRNIFLFQCHASGRRQSTNLDFPPRRPLTPSWSSEATDIHSSPPDKPPATSIAMSFETVMPPYGSTDPNASFLSSSCLDFLLIELVPLAYRLTQELDSKAATTDPSSAAAGGDAASASGHAGGSVSVAGVSAIGTAATAAGDGKMDEDEERDAVFYRLEKLGYRVGQGLVERFSRERPRFNDTLDMIKFICKDLWVLVFRKQIDNLKTNHRGVYVLTDNSFRPFSRMSTEVGGQAIARAQPFLWFPCGVLRGALAAMGVDATVQAETSELPSAVFQIKTLSTK